MTQAVEASTATILPGMRVSHPEHGPGIAIEAERNGYVLVAFGVRELSVPVASLSHKQSRNGQILGSVGTGKDRSTKAWLCFEAHALPLLDSAAALTSAKIDLLPHQVVLTHKIASVSPRRFLIADEVGLGKTIEVALVLRELASRGELQRALIIVPAGLVNNWHNELNEVFNLGFEVFGSEGDVTDRKTNAFQKHDRLIVSIDTLKRSTRVKRLMDAPRWDLVVFDEAHHLTAMKSGSDLRRTQNYKLGQAITDHTRDILLLSATPHQGDHFRFWMLIQLLNPTLFGNPEEMLDNRYRLNSVMIRRTKADACRPNGEALFARRQVVTDSFLMTDAERQFYELLRGYLLDGFDISKRQGNKGRALGFIMSIFQKIAASSFAAVRRTLRNRLLTLTIHEALLRDKELDPEGRERLMDEAREMIHSDRGLGYDSLGRGEVDRILADMKLKLIKRMDNEALESASSQDAAEYTTALFEDAVSMTTSLNFPEERERIAKLLSAIPDGRETKLDKLIEGLGKLWHIDPKEKIVIFATYLGTVDAIQREIEKVYPNQGVVVLRGGDQGAKVAAERRFRRADGPRVLVCTAAGREGINLQFARVLFNFDLPWNPMDMEQRIGRIHRYGQRDTAQVYNLVLSDTIEGRIFLLLEDKLTEIAKTVGKLDNEGNVAEDLRSQILGQLSERLNYDHIYRDALRDPTLQRTKLELDEATRNSNEARRVVFDLFQDLERFSLDEYMPISDISNSMKRLIDFFAASSGLANQRLHKVDNETYDLVNAEGASIAKFTTNRETAAGSDDCHLMGLDHPLLQEDLAKWRNLPLDEIGIAVSGNLERPVMLSVWTVEASSGKGNRKKSILPIAVDVDGSRVPQVEHQFTKFFHATPHEPILGTEERKELFRKYVEPALQREIKHRHSANLGGGFSAEMIGYIEVVPGG